MLIYVRMCEFFFLFHFFPFVLVFSVCVHLFFSFVFFSSLFWSKSLKCQFHLIRKYHLGFVWIDECPVHRSSFLMCKMIFGWFSICWNIDDAIIVCVMIIIDVVFFFVFCVQGIPLVFLLLLFFSLFLDFLYHALNKLKMESNRITLVSNRKINKKSPKNSISIKKKKKKFND